MGIVVSQRKRCFGCVPVAIIGRRLSQLLGLKGINRVTVMQKNDPKIIVALDCENIRQVREISSKLDPKLCRLKVGSTLYTHYGPALVEELQQQGFEIFLDLKFYDIPKQVAGSVRSAAELGVWMVDLHVQGGQQMMEAAVEELCNASVADKPLLIGVTVLTSMNNDDLLAMGIKEEIATMVPRMAKNAKKFGLDGVVCSPHEAALLREQLGEDFVLVTPGIRLAGRETHDQKRIMTPEDAIKAGSSYLVIGRAITEAKSPVEVLETIHAGIS